MAALQNSSDISVFKGVNARTGYAIQLNQVIKVINDDIDLPIQFWTGLDDFMKLYHRTMFQSITD